MNRKKGMNMLLSKKSQNSSKHSSDMYGYKNNCLQSNVLDNISRRAVLILLVHTAILFKY